MTSIVLTIITLTTITFAAFNRLIGSGWYKNYSRYGVYLATSLIAFCLYWLNKGEVQWAMLGMGIGYAIFRQSSPCIGWLAGQMKFLRVWSIPQAPWITHWLLSLRGIKLDNTIYISWSKQDFFEAGIIGGAIRGLYLLPFLILAYYFGHESISGLTLGITSCMLFGVIHWFWGAKGILGKLTEHFRMLSELTVGAFVIAPQVWLIALI